MSSMVHSEVHKLGEMVNYQDGTIVSKTLINKDKGTVTLFAFDKDQSLSEHTAPFDALLQVIDGEVDVVISGKKHHLTTNEMILMPANIPHAVETIEKFKMMLIMIKA
jgi:quercetin dioxygenase-like cupin family protein